MKVNEIVNPPHPDMGRFICVKKESYVGTEFNLFDTSNIQVNSLLNFMHLFGYHMVVSKNNIFFQAVSNKGTIFTKTHNTISFNNAVSMHNRSSGMPFVDDHKIVHAVKLTKKGNEIIVQNHMVKFTGKVG